MDMNYTKLSHIFLSLLIIIVSFFVLSTQAQAASNVKGWGWSSNIGWLSFSSENHPGNGAGVYSVTLATTSGSNIGRFGGHAWSPNIGWVSFNPTDVVNCPSSGVTPLSGCDPVVNMDTGNVTGWARVLSVKDGVADGGAGTVLNILAGASEDSGLINGYIYKSTDSGSTWSTVSSLKKNWQSIAVSNTGSKVVAVAYPEYVYVSNDGGVNWTTQSSLGSKYWTDLSMSSNGSKIAVTSLANYLQISSDGGSTWGSVLNLGLKDWRGVVVSSDGSRIVAVAYDAVYISTDGGTTWSAPVLTALETGFSFNFVSGSADGRVLVVGSPGPGPGKISRDGGTTWSNLPMIQRAAGLSSDGSKIVVVDGQENVPYVHVSSDSGVTWTQRNFRTDTNHIAYSITMSPDGQQVAMGTLFVGDIYTSSDGGTTWTRRTGAGPHNWTAISSYTTSGSSNPSFDNRGGWEGWINLSGLNHTSPDFTGYPGTALAGTSTKGISFNKNTAVFSGFSWSDKVVGWLSLVTGLGEPVECEDCDRYIPPSCTFGNSSRSGDDITLNWTISNDSGGAYNLTRNGTSVGGGTFNSSSVGYSDENLQPGIYTYTLTRTSAPAVSCSSNAITVTSSEPAGNTMWVQNNPSQTEARIRTGQSAEINWDVRSFNTAGYTSCRVDQLPVEGTPDIQSSLSLIPVSATGDADLTNMAKGVYDMRISCRNTESSVNYTNQVKIIVSSGTITEQ
jgi:hypothetical protein